MRQIKSEVLLITPLDTCPKPGFSTVYCKKKDATEMETINQNLTKCPAAINVATLITTSSENHVEATGLTRATLLTAKKHLKI